MEISIKRAGDEGSINIGDYKGLGRGKYVGDAGTKSGTEGQATQSFTCSFRTWNFMKNH